VSTTDATADFAADLAREREALVAGADAFVEELGREAYDATLAGARRGRAAGVRAATAALLATHARAEAHHVRAAVAAWLSRTRARGGWRRRRNMCAPRLQRG
jgi:hypothetical protein